MGDSPTLLWDVAAALLQAAKDGLAEAGLAPPPRSMVVAGINRTWDDCCPGQLTVRLSRLFLSDTFPVELQVPKPKACDEPTLGADFEVEVVACNPSQDDAGNAPPADVLDAHAQETLLRAFAVFRGLLCWAANYGGDDAWAGPAIVRSMEPIGPEGACVGYFARVSVPLSSCPCGPLDEIGEGVLLPGVVL